MDEIERLMREATPGPWRREALGGSSTVLAPARPKRNDLRCSASYGYKDVGEYCIAYPSMDEEAPPRTRVDFVNFSHADAALIVAAVNALPELLAKVKRYEEALTTIGHSLVCAPTDYAEHNASELLKAGNIARAALNQEPST